MPKTKPPKTIEDLYALPPETRAELIEGEIYMVPAPFVPHQRIVRNLYDGLAGFARGKRLGEVLFSPVDVVLSRGCVLQPDLVFVSRQRASIVRDRIEGAPDLVVEVLSPSSDVRDRKVKRDLYARHGVPEHWIVDPDARTVEALVLRDGAYALLAIFEAGDVVDTETLPGLKLPVARVFE